MSAKIKKLAIVGACGVIGKSHFEGLAKIKDLGVELAGIFDVVPEKLAAVAKEWNTKAYASYEEMLADPSVELISVATPHPLHQAQVIAALEAGKHVLCEKPIADTVSGCDAIVTAQKKSGKEVGVYYQWRGQPKTREVKRRLATGDFGPLLRMEVDLHGLKTRGYYAGGKWRGTWAGESGGYLINNGPHALDLMISFMGQPKYVTAVTRTAWQEVETDDTSDAFFEWEGGKTARVSFSCNRVPGLVQWEFFCEKGNLRINMNEELGIWKHDKGVVETIRSPSSTFSEQIASKKESVALPDNSWYGHGDVMRNFVLSLEGKEPMLAPLHEAVLSVELFCAMYYSSYTGSRVALPLARDKYDSLLAELKKLGTAGKFVPAGKSPIASL